MQSLVETLPLPQRLALAYAPARLRAQTLGLFALDAHLANLIRKGREPLLTQARLAWWRERLGDPVETRPKGDPVLDLLASWQGHEAALVALVDGWEHMVGESLGHEEIRQFAEGRAAAFAGLAALAGEEKSREAAARAGSRWALADLAAHLGNPTERERTLEAARASGVGRHALPRALRPLAVLDGLARRSLAAGGTPLADGPGSGLAALRLGILGR